MGQMKQLVTLETVHKLLLSLIPIGLLALGYSVPGIVWGQFIAMIIISMISIIMYQRLRRDNAGQTTDNANKLLPQITEWFTTKLTREQISYYFKFNFLIAISKNIVKLNSTIPFLFLGAALSTQSGLGYYKIAFAYMSLPVFFLSPISRLLSTKLPEIKVKASAAQTFKRFWQVTWLTSAASIPLTLGAIILGPFLIKFFYGQQFLPSVSVMYGLTLYPLSSALGIGLGALFRTLNKMKETISINMVTLALLIPVSYYAIQAYSIRGLVFTTVFFTLLPNLLSLIYFYRISKTTNDQQ